MNILKRSNRKGDKITFYYGFGREQYKYLPFVSTASDGSFKLNPFQQQLTFMQQQYGSQGETYFYSQAVFEKMPGSPAEKAMSPGNSWVGSGRGVSTKLWMNTAVDNIKIWRVADVVGGWGTYSVAGTYAAGDLVKTINADEHGKQVIEYKSKEGKALLKKYSLLQRMTMVQGADMMDG
ncbi:MAG: hypothetical protein IPM85_11650 [Chitinophagaceae bacterium]|nr:hypothetical protein [Chitinophagaceae bacterium]